MNVELKKINTSKSYVTYKSGYRIVYFYDNHHEVKGRLYAKNIEEFIKYFSKENETKFTNLDDLLNLFLKLDNKALGVAIYDVNQNCIARKNKSNIKEIDNSKVYLEELIYDFNDVTYEDGYRIVYFYPNDTYECGTYVKNIKDFMIDFSEDEPFMDDVLEFTSIDDLLKRYLDSMKDIIAVAIYDVKGTMIAKKAKYENVSINEHN